MGPEANGAVILLPLSPTLPLIAPIFFSTLRALQAAEVLHQPYFRMKKMDNQETWTWIEERKWGYRGEYRTAHVRADRSLRFHRILA